MNRMLQVAALVSTFSLAGCISPTTYHPYNGSDGYSEIQYNKTNYEVRFKGNTVTSANQVDNMLLYRAAEIAEQNNYPYLKVLSKQIHSHKSYFTEPGSSSTVVEKHHNVKTKRTYYTPPTTEVITDYTANMRIRLLRRRQGGRHVYNAGTLLQSLRTQIQFPKKN